MQITLSVGAFISLNISHPTHQFVQSVYTECSKEVQHWWEEKNIIAYKVLWGRIKLL